MAESDKIKWNAKYLGRKPGEDQPSDWLAAHAPLLAAQPMGRALDIACGLGRNSAFLAKQGFEVDAVDISEVALKRLSGRAEAEGLSIHTYCCDLETDPFPHLGYQVILVFNYLQRDLFDLMEKALAPGGLLVYETMHRDQLLIPGSKMNPAYLLGDNELLDAFRVLRVLAYEEKTIRSSSGRERAVARLVARKPVE